MSLVFFSFSKYLRCKVRLLFCFVLFFSDLSFFFSVDVFLKFLSGIIAILDE